MKSFENIIIKQIIVATALFVALFSYAQVPSFEENIQISISPRNPRGGDTVTIKIESFLTNLNKANISWAIDGRVSKSGIGNKSLSFKVGPSGSSTDVDIIIDTAEGARLEKQISIRPAEVDLIWEADSYVPPLYKGKALHPAEGNVKVVAFPNIVDENGNRVGSQNLIYTWRLNGTVIGSDSGYGKNVFNFKGSIFGRTESVEVSVSALDGSVTARGSINIPTTNSKIVLYQNNPLLGIVFSKALSNVFELEQEELVVEAYPYFFSVKQRSDPSIEYGWRVGGRKVENDNQESSIVLRRGEGSGLAAVSLYAQNVINVLQSGLSSFSVKFGE